MWGGNIIFVFPDSFLWGGLTPLLSPTHLATRPASHGSRAHPHLCQATLNPACQSQCPPPHSSQQLVHGVELSSLTSSSMKLPFFYRNNGT